VAHVLESLTPTSWPAEVDDVVAGDLSVMFATVTPARGVVLTPFANIALVDRGAGTVTITTSLGLWGKLERIQRNPRVALAFHTRANGASERPEYVLLQGEASFSWVPDRSWLESIGDNWESHLDTRRQGRAWDWWLSVYHWERVGIEIKVARTVVWPDLDCAGPPAVHGPELPGPAPAQRPPARGTGSRINHARAAARIRRLPHTLLGWVGADGLPMVVPVGLRGANPLGILLEAPPDVVPPGGRRAGLTAHWCGARVIGHEQRAHTGWLEPETERLLLYAPHTKNGYRLPPSTPLVRAATGFATRRGFRAGRRAGVLTAQPR
jgi:hypothetical protein